MDAGEFQIRLADLQAKLAEVQEKFRELPGNVGGAADQRVSAMFADIDPAVSPHAHAVQNAGHGFYDLIDGLVHAVAAIEKDLANNPDEPLDTSAGQPLRRHPVRPIRGWPSLTNTKHRCK